MVFAVIDLLTYIAAVETLEIPVALSTISTGSIFRIMQELQCFKMTALRRKVCIELFWISCQLYIGRVFTSGFSGRLALFQLA